MNTNKKGFTLIELLVVIVIIGILATISVATFGGYFKKARDAERQSAVQNIATILKVLNATQETVSYKTFDVNGTATVVDSKDDLDSVLALQGYSAPNSKNDFDYVYIYDGDEDDFVVGVCSEEKYTATTTESYDAFLAGTPAGVSSVGAGSGASKKVGKCVGGSKTPALFTTATDLDSGWNDTNDAGFSWDKDGTTSTLSL